MDRTQDSTIATLLGWQNITNGDFPIGQLGTGWRPVPRFSEDIGAAWTLVEYLRSQGWLYGIGDDDEDTDDQYACFYRDGSGLFEGTGPTPAAAIVAAFLLASSRAGEGKG